MPTDQYGNTIQVPQEPEMMEDSDSQGQNAQEEAAEEQAIPGIHAKIANLHDEMAKSSSEKAAHAKAQGDHHSSTHHHKMAAHHSQMADHFRALSKAHSK